MAKRAAISGDVLHEDVVLGKAFDRRLLRRLLTYARPYRARMLLALVLILFVTVLSVVGPFLGKAVIDGPLAASIASPQLDPDTPVSSTDGHALRDLCWIGALFVLTSILLMVCRFFQLYIMARIGQGAMFDLRMQVFSQPWAVPPRDPHARLPEPG